MTPRVPQLRRTAAVTLAALLLTSVLAGCDKKTEEPPATPPSSNPSGPVGPNEPAPPPEAVVPPAVFLSATGNSVDPATLLEVSTDSPKAEVASVTVEGHRYGNIGQAETRHVTLAGKLSGNDQKAVWTARERLEPSTAYRVVVKFADGGKSTQGLRTKTYDLAHQTYPTIFPSGGTYGVGQPVVVRFDLPVTDQASIEEALTVKTTPAQPGSWHWISSQEVRWRPKHYWKAGTRVSVTADTNSVHAGPNVIGQFDSSHSFSIAKVAKTIRVNLDTHRLMAYENGKLVRSWGISAGREPEYATRSGVKVIMSKERTHRMQSSSIGIDPNSGEGYDLVVDYAMRITNTGEFFHAADWNAPYFGNSNQSHGCTGSSTANEYWLYNWADLGTPARYIGTSNMMTVDNGYGDWNESFKEYKQGSAL